MTVVVWSLTRSGDSIDDAVVAVDDASTRLDRVVAPGDPGATAADDASTRQESRTARVGPAGDAILVVQADEVDRCIQLDGSELILTDVRTGEERRATIHGGSTAIFDAISTDDLPRPFRIRTALPDRGCYPSSFSLNSNDFRGEPPRAGLSLSIVHLHELRGVVRAAATRAPIADARVFVDSFTMSEARTNDDGRFVLNLNEPAGTIVVQAAGYQELLWHFPVIDDAGAASLPDQRDFELLADRLTALVEVEASWMGGPAGGARLTVVDLGPSPVPDQALATIDPNERVAFLESLQQEVDALGRITGVDGIPPDELDANGRARLRVLTPGRLRVEVALDHAFAQAVVDVTPGQRQRVTLTLADGMTVVVHATIEGRPAPGVLVGLTHPSAFASGGVVTDEAGRARFDGLPAAPSVIVSAHENGRERGALFGAPRSIELRSGVEAMTVELPLVPVVRGSGTVVDAERLTPLAGVVITSRVDRATTDAAGHISVAAPAGDAVSLDLAGYRPVSRLIPDDGDLGSVAMQALLGGSSRVEFDVRDPDGTPARQGAIAGTATVESEDGSSGLPDRLSFSLSIGPDGRSEPLSVRLLPGERASIDLEAEVGPVVARARTRLLYGESRVEPLTVLSPASARGTVVINPGRIPVPGARVVVRNRWSTTNVASELTGDDGSFALDDIAPGEAAIVVTAPFRAAYVEVTIPPSGLDDLIVELHPVRQARVVAVEANSIWPIWKAVVEGVLVTDDNTVWFPDDGITRLRVSAPGYRSANVSVSIADIHDGRISVSLRRAP